MRKGKKFEAQKALKRLRGIKYNIGPEINQLEVRLNKELAEKSSPSDLIKPWALKPLIIAVSLMIFQQLSGINAAVYNSVVIINYSRESRGEHDRENSMNIFYIIC